MHALSTLLHRGEFYFDVINLYFSNIIQQYHVCRILADIDEGIPDGNIRVGVMLAHRDQEVQFRTEVEEGGKMHQVQEVFHMDKFDTDEETLEARRKMLNANASRKTLLDKDPKMADYLENRGMHMEVRRNQIIIRKCIEELDGGKVCQWCTLNPHQLPKAVIEDFPLKAQGNGARFWDLTPDPSVPGWAFICSISCSIPLKYYNFRFIPHPPWHS